MPYKDKQGRQCGFLNVEEKEGSGKFVRRYVVLDGREQKLQYFLDNPSNLADDSQHPCGVINVAHISKVSEAKRHKNRTESTFVINHAGKTLLLQAEDVDDMAGWILELNNASKITVPTADEKRLSDQDTGYKTEIAGGVVCKIPIKDVHISDHEHNSSSDTDDSYASLPAASSVEGWKSGFCVKQGGLRKNWKRRYFVVNDTGLLYFTSEQAKEPLRTIPKTEIIGVKESHPSHTARDNLFEVITSKRTFYVQCDTPKEVKDWVAAVQKLVDTHTKPKLMRSSIRKEEEDTVHFPVMKVYPQDNWTAGTLRSQTLAPVRTQEHKVSGASKSLSFRPTKTGSVMGAEGTDNDRAPPPRLKKQRSWFLW